MVETKQINIFGIVQGVGFRPFIFKLAKKHKLKGFVKNSSFGVEIESEGDKKNIAEFLKNIKKNAPPLSIITKISSKKIDFKNYKKFSILLSQKNAVQKTLISYDVAICNDCLKDIFQKKNRRFLYPFTNCTNCGPRYSIIEEIPYDRKNTSMKHFKMCKKCQKEYDNQENRRFHAQPNACEKCGPSVSLFSNNEKKIKTDNPIKKCAELLKKGKIIAIKGLGGFHLAVDATNNKAVQRIREKKNRKTKPLALMFKDIKTIKEFVFVNKDDEKFLTSTQKPIILLRKKNSFISPSHSLSQAISPNNKYLGVMIAYTPLHQILFWYNLKALVMTSGNKKDEPIVIDNDESFKTLKNIADYFLIHNRDIYIRSDDSIVRTINKKSMFLRRARGYVPVPIFLKKKHPTILALGGELKNTICFLKDRSAFLSQHIGDIENIKSFEFFKETISHMKKVIDIKPNIIAFDKHPDYLSRRYALKQKDKKLVEVQHHHAHIVSCMAENNIEGEVIGVAYDGTGFGEDGNTWGGEILITNEKKFLRKAHLNYMAMIGGDMAAKEPYRMAFALLYDAFGKDFLNMDIPFLKNMDKTKQNFFLKMVQKKINTPLTSGMGRLFDGVSSLLNIIHINTFEGEAPMSIEMIAKKSEKGFYRYEFKNGKTIIIKTAPIIKGIIKDILNGEKNNVISAKFHNTIVNFTLSLCLKIRKETSLNRVVLSGGVFQNIHLLKLFLEKLKKENFKLFFHTKVPTNDGGLSLGQSIIASNQ